MRISLPHSIFSGWLIRLLMVIFAHQLVAQEHLLISEAVLAPTEQEYIEILNPTNSAVNLENYYLSDDDDYALLPGQFGAGPAPNISSADFIVQFPPGAAIEAAGVLVIALNGLNFRNEFGIGADYEIIPADVNTPDMLPTLVGSSAGLTNTGENATLFFWDGQTDLVSDVDIVILGMPSAVNTIANKTGLAVDGPDADTNPSTYLDDALTMPQQPAAPGSRFSTKRIALEGDNEVKSAGNGLAGHDETTENILVTWDTLFTAPNPGVQNVIHPPVSNPPVVSEVFRSVFVPEAQTVVTVTAVISDDKAVATARLLWKVNGADPDSLDMINTTADTFTADIPAGINQDGNAVEYRVRALDEEGASALSSQSGYFAGLTHIIATRVNETNGNNIYVSYAVRVRGIATVGTNVFQTSNRDFYVQDASGGINIFQFGSESPEVARGDSLLLEGTLDQFRGKLEISDPNLSYRSLSSGNPLPEPLLVTVNEVNENTEGLLIKLEQVYKKSGTWPEPGSNATLFLTDNGIDSVAMFIDGDTNVGGLPEPQYPINVAGISSQFDTSSPLTEGYQILPRDSFDITFATLPELTPPHYLQVLAGNAAVVLSWQPPLLRGINKPVHEELAKEVALKTIPERLKSRRLTDNPGRLVTGKTQPLRWSQSGTTRQDLIAYNIYRSEDRTNFTNIASAGSNELIYRDTGVVNGITYWYYVTAVYDLGESVPSDTLETTPGLAVATLPFFEGFNDPGLIATGNIPDGWQQLDLDGGDENPLGSWFVEDGIVSKFIPFEGEGFATNTFFAANEQGLIDEWLITPQLLDFQSGVDLSFYAMANGENFPDSLEVLISTTGNAPDDFTPVEYFLVGGQWEQHLYELESLGLSGEDDFYIAFRYYLVNGGSLGKSSAVVSIDAVQVDQIVGIEDTETLPTAYALEQNYPNPFNPSTTIKYALTEVGEISLTVYNVLGETIRTLVSGKQNPGFKEILWDGRNDRGIKVTSGIYIYRLEASPASASGPAFVQSKKMILMK